MTIGDAICYLAFLGAWVLGIAAAKGFWLTLACVCVPPVAWVVLAERMIQCL